METAKALALAGYDIVFVDRPGKQGERVADILMDGDTWEMKSPRPDSLKAIERNVKRARNQSPCVVLDSRRMRKVPDAAIERELRRCAKTIKGIRLSLIHISRNAMACRPPAAESRPMRAGPPWRAGRQFLLRLGHYRAAYDSAFLAFSRSATRGSVRDARTFFGPRTAGSLMGDQRSCTAEPGRARLLHRWVRVGNSAHAELQRPARPRCV